MIKKVIFIFLITITFTLSDTHKPPQELRWDWDNIDVTKLDLPKEFQFCAATAEYQVSGSACFYDGKKKQDCPDSNWSRYEQQKTLLGDPVIESSGRGIDHWNRYKEDITLIKKLGVTVYRCSLDWARIQPREGYYDTVAINHYHELFNALKKQGITPMVTLHHFVHPGWFDDKGAFEQEENIKYFVQFSQRMFHEFASKVPYWCTFNEPGVYAAQTYITNHFPRPPTTTNFGFSCNLATGFCLYGAGLVMKHLLQAHITVYKILKAMPYGHKAQIGLVHNIIQFEPCTPGNWFETQLTRFLRQVYSDPITEFLLTGNFVFRTLTSAIIFHYPEIWHAHDFIGLNYYSHVLCKWSNPFRPHFRPDNQEHETDMYYGLYAEGIYRALKLLALSNKPIYITENGLADADDTLRELWYKRYLYAVNKAIQEGVDVRMFCAWSAFDNFEWNLGYHKKFGLYHVDRTTYKRILKAGANYFKTIAHNHVKNYKNNS